MHRIGPRLRSIGGLAGVAACLAALAGAPAPPRAEAEPVKIEAQTEPGSGRLVLEWRRPVQYDVHRSDAYLFVRFSRPLGEDLAAAHRTLSGYLAELRVAGGGRVLVMRLAGTPRFTHVQRGNAVILSWSGAARASDDKPPAAEPRPTERPEQNAEETPPARAPDAPARREVETKPPPAGPSLSVARSGADTRIVAAWPEPVAAAVFRYGDNVWIVFSRKESFDLAPFQRVLAPGIERLRRIEHADATVLATRADRDVSARVEHEGNAWTIVLSRASGAAPENGVKLAISRGTREQVAVPLPDAGAPIRFVDPEVGSTLHVVPSSAPAAVAGERRFVTFRLVPAAQGAVIEALADGLEVDTEPAAVIIRRKGGLLLSGGPPVGSAQRSP